eukprot:6189862-Prymnesium_polylepis.2
MRNRDSRVTSVSPRLVGAFAYCKSAHVRLARGCGRLSWTRSRIPIALHLARTEGRSREPTATHTTQVTAPVTAHGSQAAQRGQRALRVSTVVSRETRNANKTVSTKRGLGFGGGTADAAPKSSMDAA